MCHGGRPSVWPPRERRQRGLTFLPDSNMAFPINDDTEQALRSDEPVRALRETLTLPIIEVANDPGNLGSLRLGSKVSVPVADLNDWCYMSPEGNLTGGFTVEVVQRAQRRRRTR